MNQTVEYAPHALIRRFSLLPVPFHPTVAKLCIQHKKHLVTASYISPDMAALHEESAWFLLVPCVY